MSPCITVGNHYTVSEDTHVGNMAIKDWVILHSRCVLLGKFSLKVIHVRQWKRDSHNAQFKANVVDYKGKSTRETDYLNICTAHKILSIPINHKHCIYITTHPTQRYWLLVKSCVLSRRPIKSKCWVLVLLISCLFAVDVDCMSCWQEMSAENNLLYVCKDGLQCQGTSLLL